MHGTIELPALRRAADLLPATIDEQDRSIEVVWSTGARVRRQPLFGEPFDEELSMDPGSVRLDRLNAGGPLLKVHDTRTLDAIIGSVVPGSARIDQGRGVARVRFSEREAVSSTRWPVETSPVMEIMRTSGCEISGLPTVSPRPSTRLNTPAGKMPATSSAGRPSMAATALIDWLTGSTRAPRRWTLAA